MTNIFYDTEFLEDGSTIELISIGMVTSDGRELYAVSDEVLPSGNLYGRLVKHNWLTQNVVRHLPLSSRHRLTPALGATPAVVYFDEMSNVIMPRRMIRNAVAEFVTGTHAPELWAWYGAYDHVALCQLFGTMLDLPTNFPMYTNDLQTEVNRVTLSHGKFKIPKHDGRRHHALDDAHHAKQIFDALHDHGRSTSDE